MDTPSPKVMPIAPSLTPISTGEWPAVPPAPTPVKPLPPATPEPPAITAAAPLLAPVPPVIPAGSATTPATTPAAAAEPTTAAASTPVRTAAPTSTPAPRSGLDDDPTVTLTARPAPRPLLTTARRITRFGNVARDESPIVALQRSVRRQQHYERRPGENLVWQPRFAYASGAVIVVAFLLVTLPLWLVLYRSPETAANHVSDVMSLSMMLLGGLLTCAATWSIIIEMRGRVRMVDTLARTGDREAMAAPEIPMLDSPVDSVGVGVGVGAAAPAQLEAQTAWSGGSLAARAEAQQITAAQTLDASSKLLSAFSGVLKSFGQLPAQIAMLAVALVLFVGATVLSLH